MDRRFPAAMAFLLWSAAAADQDPARLEEVQVTAGRTEQSTSDVSAGVSVVNSQDIQRQAPAVAADLLRGVTGAFVQQTTPGQGTPIIRGLKGSEVLHLVDGMRLNNALFRNAPNQYLALIDARMLSRLEVVRGPSPTLYGADAMGGVVQLVSQIPEVGVTRAFAGRLVLDYGSADEAALAHLNLSQSGAALGYAVAATYQDVGDREAGDNTELTDSAFTSRAVRGVVRVLPREDQEWLFDVQYLRQPGTPRHDELVAGFGQVEPASAVFSFEPNDRIFAHTRYQWRNVNQYIDDLELHAGYQLIRDDRRTRDSASTSLRTERNKSELFGLTVQLRSVASAVNHLTYGLEAYFDEVSSSRIATDTVTGDSMTVLSRFPDGSTMDSLALYLHDQISAGRRLTLDAGARYTYVDVDLPMADRAIGARVKVNDLTANIG
ncbi:MAG: TonB-dependent receptor, partial [Gammaproteobacteria bacterium]|nr:TonB-dependent receptor [Gammaproteobacteria bacterium]